MSISTCYGRTWPGCWVALLLGAWRAHCKLCHRAANVRSAAPRSSTPKNTHTLHPTHGTHHPCATTMKHMRPRNSNSSNHPAAPCRTHPTQPNPTQPVPNPPTPTLSSARRPRQAHQHQAAAGPPLVHEGLAAGGERDERQHTHAAGGEPGAAAVGGWLWGVAWYMHAAGGEPGARGRGCKVGCRMVARWEQLKCTLGGCADRGRSSTQAMG